MTSGDRLAGMAALAVFGCTVSQSGTRHACPEAILSGASFGEMPPRPVSTPFRLRALGATPAIFWSRQAAV